MAERKKAVSKKAVAKKASSPFDKSGDSDSIYDLMSAAPSRGAASNFSFDEESSGKKSIKLPDFIGLIRNNQTAKLISVAVISALIGSLITLAFTSGSSSTDLVQSAGISVTDGKTALTEGELRTAVKNSKRTVYWAGPIDGAKYTLTLLANKAFVRYLPNGDGLSDTTASFRIVGTYAAKNAYDATKAAGNNPKGMTFINPDGAIVYYAKTRVTNIYVAFKGSNNQIELYDPSAATALLLANTAGKIQQIN